MEDLDTTIEISKYNKELINNYNYYFFKLRKKYLNLIDRRFYKNLNIDILSSSVAEKNISNSYVYHYLCLYFSVINITKKQKIRRIIVDSKFLEQNLRKKLDKKEIILKKKKDFKSTVNLVKIVIRHIFIHIFSKMINKKLKFLNSITIVDRFITNENPNIDRYYNNFYYKKKNIYQVPTFVNLSLRKIIIFLIKSRKKNFLLKNNYLNSHDIFFSLMFYFRSKKISYKKIYFEKLDISTLINEEFKKVSNFNASVIGIQNYLFAKKLEQNKFKVNKIINWNENSIVDKGWNCGFRTFFPECKTYGYQNYFIEKKFSSLDITSNESKLTSVPEYLLTISKNLRGARTEFTKNLKFINVKALRFDYLYNQKMNVSKFDDSIIILLNLNINDNLRIIKRILKTKFSIKGNKIYVKEHPLLKLHSFYHEDLPNNWKIINGNFSNIVKKFKIVIASGSSSSIFESIFLGCKVIFPINNHYDNYNLELIKLPKNLFKICETVEDLDLSIIKILNQKIDNFMYFKSKTKLKKFVNKKKYLI